MCLILSTILYLCSQNLPCTMLLLTVICMDVPTWNSVTGVTAEKRDLKYSSWLCWSCKLLGNNKTSKLESHLVLNNACWLRGYSSITFNTTAIYSGDFNWQEYNCSGWKRASQGSCCWLADPRLALVGELGCLQPPSPMLHGQGTTCWCLMQFRCGSSPFT